MTSPTESDDWQILAEDDPGFFGGMVVSAWEAICESFAEAATDLLEFFADAFLVMPDINVGSGGIQSAYAISMGIGIVIAGILMFIQLIKTVVTSDGKALADGLTGLGKAVLAMMLTLTLASTALMAADELAAWIIEVSFEDTDGLHENLIGLFEVTGGLASALILVIAVVAILVVLVLWFELLLRNAAIAVLIATAPIAAAGQVGSATKEWWPKLVAVTIQLIILKPLIALIFAIGFNLVGDESSDVSTILSGILVLVLAALAWPAIARFMTFTASPHVGGSAGAAGMIGAGAGVAGGMAAAGASPSNFSRGAEAKNESAVQRASSAASSGGGGAAGSAVKAGAGPLGAVAAGLKVAQKASNTLVQRSEQMAAHGGIQGANPYAMPGGLPKDHASGLSRRGADTGGEPRPGENAPRVNDGPPEPPPETQRHPNRRPPDVY